MIDDGKDEPAGETGSERENDLIRMRLKERRAV